MPKRIPIFLALLLCGMRWSVPQARAQEETGILVLEDVHVFDGTGRPPLDDAVVIIGGDSLSYVGEKSQAPAVPPRARVMKLEGRWVIPGLIDSHVHYREWMPEFFLYYGVTSVLDTGNPTDWILAQREGVRLGRIKGPRIFAAGTGINGPAPPGLPEEDEPSHVAVRSAEQAVASTRNLLERGVDVIKIQYRLPSEWASRVAEEAHRAGKPVLGHLGGPVDAFVHAGLDALIHPYGIDLATLPDKKTSEEIRRNMERYQQGREYYPYHWLDPAYFGPLIRLLVERNVFFNPTFGAQFRGVYPQREPFEAEDKAFLDRHSPELSYLPEPIRGRLLPFFTLLRGGPVDQEQRRRMEDGMQKMAVFMREFAAAGGRLLAGTDSSRFGIPGMRLHRELELWVRFGISPWEALRAATQYPAELLKQDRRLGTLEAGKLADLVVLKGNPLEDISRTRDIEVVILGGKVLDRAFHPDFINPLPTTHFRERFLPRLERIEPASTAAGAPSLTLRLYGSNFDPNCRALLSLEPLQSRLISSRELEAVVPSSLLREPGTYPVTVWRAGSGGGPSDPVYLLVDYGSGSGEKNRLQTTVPGGGR